MNMIEILGYVAMVLVAGSFLLKDVVKLRLVNSCGAVCFVVYGLLIGSVPVAGLNIFVVCVNAYYIFLESKTEKIPIQIHNNNNEIKQEEIIKLNGKKTQVRDDIAKIKKGTTDSAGNSIINILAKYNEYVIYEIDDTNIQNRIKVFIDGDTDESEMKILQRFNMIKSDYIQAKGILFHSTNFETNKQRVAHILSTYLNDDNLENKNLFKELIESIHQEQNTILLHRLTYLFPSFITLIIISCCQADNIQNIQSYLATSNNNAISLVAIWAILIGGTLSIIINSKNLNMQEFKGKGYYFLVGLERMILAVLAGLVAIIVLKTGIINIGLFTNNENNQWIFLFILVVSGFSEQFIPSVLAKSEIELQSNKK